MLEVFKSLFAFYLGIQWISVLLFLVAEWAMVDYYKMGTFESPKSICEKIPDFTMKFTFCMGFYLYSKFSKDNWGMATILDFRGRYGNKYHLINFDKCI